MNGIHMSFYFFNNFYSNDSRGIMIITDINYAKQICIGCTSLNYLNLRTAVLKLKYTASLLEHIFLNLNCWVFKIYI